LSNCTFDRGSLTPTYSSPFDVLVRGNQTGNWRRGWDSNPRAPYGTRRFRGAPVTTTSVPLRGVEDQANFNYTNDPRRPRRTACTSWPHAPSSTPPMAVKRWLRPGSSPPRTVDTSAPDFGSVAPYTTVARRACTIAPTHIRHGSIVTHSVAPPRR